MAKHRNPDNQRNPKSEGPSHPRGPRAEPTTSKLRIVGGEFRGRQIIYSGDRRTRPMKDSIRESLFNLIGGFVVGRCAFDLFAGTGAVGIEAISRGATHAHFLERHFPTARIIRDNLKSLGEDLPATVHTEDTFFWTRQFFAQPDQLPPEPWLVFCCPPYALYKKRWGDLHEALDKFLAEAPPSSLVVVEAPMDFDPALLPHADQWRLKTYPPAQICIWRPLSYENQVEL